MNISSDFPRGSLFVPSFFCQSLLGKAIQEHFTEPRQIASVFSSSPSLRNSSAGANFLTNFKIDEKSLILFQVVFTPEDCSSIEFSFSIGIDLVRCHSEQARNIFFNFFRNLITKSRYLEASLRSLEIRVPLITDDHLHSFFYIGSDAFKVIYSFVEKFIKQQKYLQASLRSLIYEFACIDDDQLHFSTSLA
jgi:hypothetical protein